MSKNILKIVLGEDGRVGLELFVVDENVAEKKASKVWPLERRECGAKGQTFSERTLIRMDNKQIPVKLLDKISWDDKNKTSQNLLKQIDSFLIKNNLEVTDLAEVQTGISDQQKFTLARIIKITAKTMNYCLGKSD